MPSVTINIADRGTKLAEGGESSVGHMWYEITDNNGNSTSYGFAPDKQHHGDPFAPGQVYRNDTDNYRSTAESRTIEITQAQYDALKAFGDDPAAGGFNTYYNGLWNSCIDFTWMALEKAGLNPSGFEGNLWPTHNIDRVKQIVAPIISPPNAARVTDKTLHSGTVSEGSPNVEINGQPAARLTDPHICPDMTDGFPHTGGPIVEGSATVIINGLMAARLGDGLLCVGEPPSVSDDDNASVKHGKEEKFGEADDKKWGDPQIDERRGPKKYQKDPLLDIHVEKNWFGDSGELWKSDDGRVKLGSGEYHGKSQIDVEIRAINDFRATIDLIDIGGSVSAAEATDKLEGQLGTLEGKVKVLHAEADLAVQAHIDTKKKQMFVGGNAKIGGSVLEATVSGKTKQLRIPFTNWGISLTGGAEGSLLTAKLDGHFGARFDPKKGFSMRGGGSFGALLAGFGLDFGLEIAPMDPPAFPLDRICTGSSTVLFGP